MRCRDLPIALPQLTGAHTGERIAEVVGNIIDVFGITQSQLGYFVLDNALQQAITASAAPLTRST